MIAHLRGRLLVKRPNQVVIETGGVGYEVNISVRTYSELPAAGSDAALHIYTHLRQDVIALYGFFRPAEKQLFEKLMTVSGIGAKLAITILSGMPSEELASAIRENQIARLTKIPGIGKKTAERMVLELRDKMLPAANVSGPGPVPEAISALEEDVASALVNLGYPRPIAEKAVASLIKPHNSESFDSVFREALARLSK
jgi:holliday junction DNA helicase RuvA